MKTIKTWHLFGILGAVFGGLYLIGSSEKDGQTRDQFKGILGSVEPNLPELPTTERLTWETPEFNPELGYLPPPTPIVDGKPLTWIPPGEKLQIGGMASGGYDHLAPKYLERWSYAQKVMAAWFKKNRLAAGLPPTPGGQITDDGKSQVAHRLNYMFLFPIPVTVKNVTGYSGHRTSDEFGRMLASENTGDGGGFDPFGGLADSFGNLMKNPLFKAAVSIALVAFGGPAGVAVLGAYNVYAARGQEWSLKNAALTAARTYAVSQCGEVCGAAFDFGVGVASGDSVDEAAESALYGQMSPEERAMYEEGKAAYKDMTG